MVERWRMERKVLGVSFPNEWHIAYIIIILGSIDNLDLITVQHMNILYHVYSRTLQMIHSCHIYTIIYH